MMKRWRRPAAAILTVALLISNFISVYPDSFDDVAPEDWYEETWSGEAFDEPFVDEGVWEEEPEENSFEDISFEDASFEDTSFEDASFEDTSIEDTSFEGEAGWDDAEIEDPDGAGEQNDEEFADDGAEDFDEQAGGEEVTDSALSAVEEIGETAEEEEVNTQAEFTADAGGVTVTAIVERPEALPAGIEFWVTPVTRETEGYNYEAYLAALNDNAGAIGQALGSEDLALAEDSTLLYDIAFMADGKDDEGNVVEGRKVEVQPEQGSVQIHFDFHDDRLAEIVDAENADAVTVVHLPLADEIREAVDATSEARNIGVDDIRIDVLTDSYIDTGSGASADFSLDSFSVTAIAAYRSSHNGAQAWTGTTPTTASAVRDDLGLAGGFSLFANEYNMSMHIEGTFAVRNLLGVASQFGNTAKTYLKSERYSVTVKKVSEGARKTGTFRFGLFDGNTKIDEIAITTDANGQGSGTFDGLFGSGSNLTVYELDANGNRVNGGSGYTEDGVAYTVTYGGTQTVSNLGTTQGNTSYAEFVSGFGNNVFNKDGYNPVLVVGSTTNVDSTGRRITVGGQTYDAGEGGTIIKAEGAFPISFDSEFNRLNALSGALADATDGSGLHVVNVKATQSGYIADLARALGYRDQNAITNSAYGLDAGQGLNEGEILLINIDCSDLKSYFIGESYVNGKKTGYADSSNGMANIASDRILFNFVQRGSNGFVPYTGEVSFDCTSGTMLAPSATVTNFNSIGGAVIANRILGHSGEIHGDSMSGGISSAAMECKNVSTGTTPTEPGTVTPSIPGGSGRLEIWKTINADDRGNIGYSSDDNKIRSELEKQMYFVIEGPHGYSRTVYYSEFTDFYTGRRWLSEDNLPAGTYTVTEFFGDLEGYQYTTDVRVWENYPGDWYFPYHQWTTVSQDSCSGSGSINDRQTAKFWFNNRYTKGAYNFRKVDTEGNELPGAKLRLSRSEWGRWTTVAEWTSEEWRSHAVTGLARNSTYRLEEISAPEGYAVAEPIVFQIGADGKISITSGSGQVSSSGITLTMVDKYNPAEAVLEAQKSLIGADLLDGQFEFELAKEDGEIVETAQNDGKGAISFQKLRFEEPGTYTYTITEINGGDDSIIFDTAGFKAVVDVSVAAGEGLKASVTYYRVSGGSAELVELPTFRNKTKAKAKISATKTLLGRELEKDAFTFELEPVKSADENDPDNPLAEKLTAKNAADGSISFDEISFVSAGNYFFILREAIPEGAFGEPKTLGGIIYDEKTYSVKVVVTDDADSGLTAEVIYLDGEEVLTAEPEFINRAAYDMELLKLNGNSGKPMEVGSVRFKLQALKAEISGERDDDVNWEGVADVNGSAESAIDADGRIEYTGLVPGTYRLIETEHPGDFGGFNQPIVFTVSEEGQFETEIENDTFFQFTTSSSGTGGGAADKVTLTVKNYKSIIVPESGGNGAVWSMIFGALIAFFGIILLISGRGRKRKLI